jgi:Ca-activated chloride channel family protein
MARVGMGEPFIITRPEEASSRAEHFRNVIRHPVLTGINVSFQNFDAYDIEPPAAPDLFAERPVVMFGKYRGKAAGKIVVSGMSGDGRYAEIVDPGKVQPSKCNGALRYLWARHRISLLSDYNRLRADEKRVGFITELGLTYNLLTAYTSFVAVDTGIRATDGRPVTVRQPLPLPLGVSDYAIGESGGVRAMMPVPSPMGNGGMFAARELKIRREPPTHGTSQDSVRVSVPTGRTIRMAETAVDGGLSKEDVSNLVRTFLPSLVKCWKTGGPGGEVTVRLVVGADGRVKRAAVIRSTTGTGGDVACLKAITKAWQFPRTSDGKEAGITISFVVSP